MQALSNRATAIIAIVAITAAVLYFVLPNNLGSDATHSSLINTESLPPIQLQHSNPFTNAAAERNRSTFDVKVLGRRAYAINQTFEPPHGDAAEVVARLLPAAQAGDEVAAFNIYLKIAACRNELDQARREAPDTAPQALISSECQSVSPERYGEYMRWLETSAEQGYVPAQLLYAVDSRAIVGDAPQMLGNPEAVATYRNKAMRYLHHAVATGNVDALRGLASAYGNGVLTKRDPVTSYAYSIAAETAQPTELPPEITRRVRDNLEHGMTQEEINRATTQGRKIYEACCSQ
ncbi:hypothetical protein [Lysobacter sp. GCM10012299]|uniref:hypothetical protein n=1 Tax=Lysobacter sp. GCM10012299 TaxID=3317333 RepID=UPI003605E45B